MPLYAPTPSRRFRGYMLGEVRRRTLPRPNVTTKHGLYSGHTAYLAPPNLVHIRGKTPDKRAT